uniref:type II toxin-antitoxin system HicB family antitoxin n=1 Tax=Lamprocystis purpurea TaxID=61598 RepID=UPI00146E7146
MDTRLSSSSRPKVGRCCARKAALTPEPDGGFVVQFLDFGEAFTEGKTLEEALFNAAEVLTLTLDGRMDEGQPIPAPS